ncbi:hypothetical protein [Micromonospora sp. NPDC005206]|uniref:hypothetical protein n=1 Tax=Micromonospora sp. NPDC005206 TaxID=3157022 RepID=UPI0033BA1FDC
MACASGPHPGSYGGGTAGAGRQPVGEVVDADGVGGSAYLVGPAVIIGTAAKWATIAEGCWPWAIVDEAY